MKKLQTCLLVLLARPNVDVTGSREKGSQLHVPLRSRRNVNITNNIKMGRMASSLRRKLTPVRCDYTTKQSCFVTTPRSFLSNATFSPSSFLSINGTSVDASVQSLIIRSEFKCDVLFCRMSFEKFQFLQIAGSVVASDIYIEVGTLNVLQGGEISGTERGYVAGTGTGPGYDYWGAHGASHGGVGGYSGDAGTPAAYGTENKPTDFGSGGTGSDGGGRIYILASLEVNVDGTITENGGACVDPTIVCASASGGSIYIESGNVLGSGYITANGGALPQVGLASDSAAASGAGGRIAIRHNVLSSTLTIEVAGGAISDQLPDHCQGQQGSVYTECLSSFCNNGGEKTGDCGCKCVAPWKGHDCSICPLECKNGGQLEDVSCSCSCKPEWTGEDCSQCNDATLCNSNGVCSALEISDASSSRSPTFSCVCAADFYGDNCDTYCHPMTTCGGSGLCSEDGKSCQCAEGKVGEDCACDATDCSASNPCSGNGKCMDSVCFCSDGFLGCDCTVKCLASTDCSGNGSCNRDGTCACNLGFKGSNCAEQDITTYCSTPSSTITGLPCLPLINDKLGYGINAVDGKTTIPVLGMMFTEGRTKTILGKNYELPDNVDCEEVTSSDVTFSTQEYRTASSYQDELVRELGVSGAKKGVYMSSSAEYDKIKQEVFHQQKAAFKSDLVHGRFVCRFRDQSNSALSSNVQNAISTLKGDHLMEAIGTHYIHEVAIGGHISVLNFVNSCVFEKLSASQVQKRIESSVYTLAAASESKGAFGVVGGDSSSKNSDCDLFSLNTNFEKVVVGGKRELLTNPSAETAQDLKEWFNSLTATPGIVQISVKDIALVIPSIIEDLDVYINGIQLPEDGKIYKNNSALTECLPEYCDTVVVTTQVENTEEEPNNWKKVAIAAIAVAGAAVFCLLCVLFSSR